MNTAWLSLTVTLSLTWGTIPQGQLQVSPSLVVADRRVYPFGSSVCVEPANVSYGADGIEVQSAVSVTAAKE